MEFLLIVFATMNWNGKFIIVDFCSLAFLHSTNKCIKFLHEMLPEMESIASRNVKLSCSQLNKLISSIHPLLHSIYTLYLLLLFASHWFFWCDINCRKLIIANSSSSILSHIMHAIVILLNKMRFAEEQNKIKWTAHLHLGNTVHHWTQIIN